MEEDFGGLGVEEVDVFAGRTKGGQNPLVLNATHHAFTLIGVTSTNAIAMVGDDSLGQILTERVILG